MSKGEIWATGRYLLFVTDTVLHLLILCWYGFSMAVISAIMGVYNYCLSML